MQLYDPTAVIPDRNLLRAPALPNLTGKTIGVLHNNKLNASLMLTAIADLFVERHGCKMIEVFDKTNASAPAPSATLEEMAEKADFIITGLGD